MARVEIEKWEKLENCNRYYSILRSVVYPSSKNKKHKNKNKNIKTLKTG